MYSGNSIKVTYFYDIYFIKSSLFDVKLVEFDIKNIIHQ